MSFLSILLIVGFNEISRYSQKGKLTIWTYI